MVWCELDPARAPRYLHATVVEAEAEAERLARMHRGQKFYVLEIVGAVRSNDVSWDRVTDDKEIPF